MQKRSILSIGFLMISTVAFLTYYGWGADTVHTEAQPVIKEVKELEENAVGEQKKDQAASITPVVKDEMTLEPAEVKPEPSEETSEPSELTSEPEENHEDQVTEKSTQMEQPSKKNEDSGQKSESEEKERSKDKKEEEKTDKKKQKRYGRVKTKAVNVRVKPVPDAKVKKNLEKGKKFLITDETFDGWYKIEFDGMTGYIYSEYVQLIKEK